MMVDIVQHAKGLNLLQSINFNREIKIMFKVYGNDGVIIKVGKNLEI